MATLSDKYLRALLLLAVANHYRAVEDGKAEKTGEGSRNLFKEVGNVKLEVAAAKVLQGRDLLLLRFPLFLVDLHFPQCRCVHEDQTVFQGL